MSEGAAEAQQNKQTKWRLPLKAWLSSISSTSLSLRQFPAFVLSGHLLLLLLSSFSPVSPFYADRAELRPFSLSCPFFQQRRIGAREPVAAGGPQMTPAEFLFIFWDLPFSPFFLAANVWPVANSFRTSCASNATRPKGTARRCLHRLEGVGGGSTCEKPFCHFVMRNRQVMKSVTCYLSDGYLVLWAKKKEQPFIKLRRPFVTFTPWHFRRSLLRQCLVCG